MDTGGNKFFFICNYTSNIEVQKHQKYMRI